MSNPAQLAEENVNEVFGTSLSTEQHTLAVQITKEIYWEADSKVMESKTLTMEEWHERVSKFEQDFQTRLNQSDTPQQLADLRFASLRLQKVSGNVTNDIFNNPQVSFIHCKRGIKHAEDFIAQGETDSKVREQVLSMYMNGGITQGQVNDVQQAMEYCQCGIKHAEDFIAQGETDSNVRKQVLGLYENYSATYNNIGQIGQVIQLLPMQGLWSWIALNQLESNSRQIILGNWTTKLGISHNPSHFTTAFHSLLRKIVLNYHSPELPHRHFGFIPTQTLLAISEGLYALEQSEENRYLQTVYHNLEYLNDLPFIDEAQILQTQKQELEQTLATINQSNGLKQRFQKWQVTRKLKQNQQEQIRLSQNPLWQEQTERQVLENWLYNNINSRFNLHELDDLSAIVLGVILASNGQEVLVTWNETTPWQDAATLQTILDSTNWRTWAARIDEPILEEWIESLDNSARLQISQSYSYFAQPELQAEFLELATGNVQKLANRLDSAWETVQKSAADLVRTLTALADFNFQGNWSAKYKYEDCYQTYQTALAMVILGDAPQQIKAMVEIWLQQQSNEGIGIPVIDTFNTLKYRFTRAVSIYRPNHRLLEGTVHEWAKKSLTEVSTESEQELWNILERTRVGLNSLSLHLPKDWADTLGTDLWQDLSYSIKMLEAGHQPTDQEMWPPLATWLQTLENWLDKPPSIQQCQHHLKPTEALVQPFFDPIQQRLRILWLDQQGIRLRELPADCADQQLWITDDTTTGIISQWTRGIDTWKQELYRNRGKTTNMPHWETVLQSKPVTSFADTLHQWATELTQLTVIFPAPLGQLPWESLPQLESILVREISVGHWYSSKSQSTESTKWVISDPGGTAQCMIREAKWVAKHLTTKSYTPTEPSVFDALHNLANCQQAHLATHGSYNRNDPNSSYLTLAVDKGIKFPLWMTAAIRTKADLIFLSACESNLNGQATEGLLTPVGIGPTLAAAGAKTVVGTLWPCDGLAALCFSYYFYTTAQNNSEMPWHQVAAKARNQLREMKKQELQTIITEFDLRDENDLCWKLAESYEAKSKIVEKPFNRFDLWAGFTMLGQAERFEPD